MTTTSIYYTKDNGEVEVLNLSAQCTNQLRGLGEDEDKKPHEDFFVRINDGLHQGCLVLIRSQKDSGLMLRMRTTSQSAITWLAGVIDGVTLQVA